MKLCTRPFEGIYITDEEVKLCPWMDIAVGEVLGKPIDELWKSETAEKIRDSIRDGSFRYCRKEECPFCASGELEDLPDEIVKNFAASEDIEKVNVSYDIFCNHSCPSCRDCVFQPDEKYKEKMGRLKEWVLPIANKAKDIATCGRGDCFSSPFIMDFLKDLNPERENVEILFETNGVLLDEKHWNALEHLHKYKISLCVTPNSFERYTYRYLSGGHDNLEKTKANLKFVSKLRKEQKIACLKINMVVQESNYREIPSFIQTCLDEYEPDLIQIKPINFWFYMKEEDYWFKNVLNPLHPYHKDYLDVMSDPVLKNEKVRDWTKLSHDREPLRHPAYRNVQYVKLLAKLASTGDMKEYLHEVLERRNITRMAIYGIGIMGKTFHQLCACEDIMIPYFIDKWNYGIECEGMTVKPLYGQDFSDVDAILVTAVAFFDDICEELRTEGYRGQIVSIAEL